MKEIINKAKKEFFKNITLFGKDPYNLVSHVAEVEKWAKYMLKKYPKADKEIVLLSVWLHDIGLYPINTKLGHSIESEKKAKVFLKKQNYPKTKMPKVLHCIRAHRGDDVLPKTIEAKIIVFIDSASHLTDAVYFRMLKDNKDKNKDFDFINKMKRDFEDLSYFPEIKKDLKNLFHAWERLLKEYERINL